MESRGMRRFIIALAVGLSAVVASQAFAADEPANVIKYRQNVMRSIGGHIGAIAAIVKGEVSFTDDVAAHARGINAMSKVVPHIFPKGTDNASNADTRALPAIWEDMGKFDAAVKAFQAASASLVTVAEAGDPSAFGGALGELGKACGGCHKPFRAEKK